MYNTCKKRLKQFSNRAFYDSKNRKQKSFVRPCLRCLYCPVDVPQPLHREGGAFVSLSTLFFFFMNVKIPGVSRSQG